MRQIQCKYTPKLLAPRNAFDSLSGDYQTTDGKVCSIDFLACWKNTDGQMDADLDACCHNVLGCSFNTIRSIWIGRLGQIDEFWYLIRLTPKA